MSRLEKKCLVASSCFHGSLVLLVLFGSAFFKAHRNEPPLKLMNVVPTTLIDEALSGGGGNPKLPQTDDRIKGDTLKPVPPPAAEPPKQAKPEAKVDPVPPPPDPPKAKPTKTPDAPPKVVKPVKEPPPKLDEPKKPSIDLAELRPVKSADTERERKKEKEEQEARERAAAQKAERQARERADRVRRAAESLTSDLRREFSGSTSRLTAGFRDGTKVDVGGPGGAAFANYKQFVQMAYDNAWIVTPELTDQDFVAVVKVTVSRTGRIISSRIVSPSGSSLMDRGVQKALDAVRSEGLPPFPNGATDQERTFTIEFNLKSKSRLG